MARERFEGGEVYQAGWEGCDPRRDELISYLVASVGLQDRPDALAAVRPLLQGTDRPLKETVYENIVSGVWSNEHARQSAEAYLDSQLKGFVTRDDQGSFSLTELGQEAYSVACERSRQGDERLSHFPQVVANTQSQDLG